MMKKRKKKRKRKTNKKLLKRTLEYVDESIKMSDTNRFSIPEDSDLLQRLIEVTIKLCEQGGNSKMSSNYYKELIKEDLKVHINNTVKYLKFIKEIYPKIDIISGVPQGEIIKEIHNDIKIIHDKNKE